LIFYGSFPAFRFDQRFPEEVKFEEEQKENRFICSVVKENLSV